MNNLSEVQNPIDNYKLIYSPRTTYNTRKSLENNLYKDLLQSFDPYTLKILRRHFKEHLGTITKDIFICILKRHLFSWHPKIKNRPRLLLKLLSELFDEIDLDSNDKINWNEFSNFLVYIGSSRKNEDSVYFLRQYFQCKTNFDHIEKNENFDDEKIKYMNKIGNVVSYCFYIQKYRFLGLIHEGKNKILFFNSENQKRLKLEIDLSSIQDEMDKYEVFEFEYKTEVMLEKQEKEMAKNKIKIEENNRKFFLKHNKRYMTESRNNPNSSSDENSLDILQKNSKSTDKKINENNRVSTPSTIKKERILKSLNLKKNINNNYKSTDKKNDNNNKTIEKKVFHIVNTLFLNNYNLLFISSTNNVISAWIYKEKEEYFENVNLISQNIDNPHNKKECVFEKNNILIPLFSTEHTQYTMCFDYVTNNLYSGQNDGKILKWEMTINKPILTLDINDFNKNNEKNNLYLPKIKNQNDFNREALLKKGNSEFNKFLKSFPENKRSTVSCLIHIDPLKLICSSHYNGMIVLWDLIYNKPKRIYNDQKTCIYQVIYDYIKNHIYTCGFEHDIFIYDPYIDNEAIYRLKGHKSSVNSIALIPQNNELLSVDILGTIKIWDTTNFVNFQTININESTILEANHLKSREEIYNKTYKKKLSANIHIQTFPDLKKFLIYGKKFLLFEKGDLVNPLLSDEYMIIGCFYNPKTNNIITISSKKVKFWNIFNGKLMKTYSNLMDSDNITNTKNNYKDENYEITSFTYDSHFKKLYLGDSLGRIKSFYMLTGDYIKNFEPHNYEITHMLYSNKFDYLISCSSDLKLKVHKDNGQKDSEYKVMRDLYLLQPKISEKSYNKIFAKKLVFDEDKSLLITCLSNGLINEFDVEHFKMLNEIDLMRFFYDSDTNVKNMAQVSSGEYIKDTDTFFICLDNNLKKLIALKNNKYFNALIKESIGNFIDKNENNNNGDVSYKKYTIIFSCYDNLSKKLFLGDSFGYLISYDLSCLYDNLINKKFSTNEEIINAAQNDININEIFKVQIHKEPITYIIKPKELIPSILITVSTDRTVKLVNFNTGEYIDSFKQISIKDMQFPIAVRYWKENPFEKFSPLKEEKDIYNEPDKNQNDETDFIPNNIDEEEFLNQKYYPYIMYRKDIKQQNESAIPKINKYENRRQELINYSNAVLLHTVKEKLRIPKFGQQIPDEKSTLWNYQIDVDYLKKMDYENLLSLSKKVGNKEKEINITENNFKEFEIDTNNYYPKYIKDLGQIDKDKMKDAISSKIKEVNLAYNKRAKTKKEMSEFSKNDKNNDYNIENLLNKKIEGNNFFITPLKPIKTKSVTFKNKKYEDKLPLIEEALSYNEQKDNNNNNKSSRNFDNNIKIHHSPNKYQYLGDIYKSNHISTEDKFKGFKSEFDEKINDILGPMEFIKLMKKKNKI